MNTKSKRKRLSRSNQRLDWLVNNQEWEVSRDYILQTKENKNNLGIQIITRIDSLASLSKAQNKRVSKLLAASPEMVYVLQACEYAMMKFAEDDCSREIKSVREVLKKAGFP